MDEEDDDGGAAHRSSPFIRKPAAGSGDPKATGGEGVLPGEGQVPFVSTFSSKGTKAGGLEFPRRGSSNSAAALASFVKFDRKYSSGNKKPAKADSSSDEEDDLLLSYDAGTTKKHSNNGTAAPGNSRGPVAKEVSPRATIADKDQDPGQEGHHRLPAASSRLKAQAKDLNLLLNIRGRKPINLQ